MTLIVVTKNRVLVDSYESNGTLKFEIGSKKVRTHRVIPGKFVVAGGVPDWSIAVGGSKTKEELLSSSFPCDSADQTSIIWIVDGEVYVLECSKGATWYKLSRTSPINYQAGAGWRWFEAYFAQSGNVDAAFELACSLHPQCSLPVNIIEIEDRT